MILEGGHFTDGHIIAYPDALKSKLDTLQRHQAETAAGLDALLPAVLERACSKLLA